MQSPAYIEPSAAQKQRALEGVVVLDLAGHLGNYCGKLFADMGADVILVEPLSGAPTRMLQPRIQGCDGTEASLVHQYQNVNKRSIALDLDSSRGQELLRLLVKQADVLIECERPGIMSDRGLDYPSLREIRPSLIMTSITPFGQHGPYAQWQGTDLIAMGLGGMLYLGGYTDTAPMVACGEQAIGAANLFAAVATIAALFDAEVSRSGQHVDVAMQECVVMGMENAVQFYDLEGTIRKRTAGEQRLAGTGVFRCKDGYVYLMAGGIGGNRFWKVTSQWLVDEKVDGARTLLEPQWNDQDFLASKQAKDIFTTIFQPFALSLTKAELQEKGRTRRIPVAPICDTSDFAESAQRKHRGYFVNVDGPQGTKITMPGAPYQLSETPWSLRQPAPRFGQHTDEILSALGIAREELRNLKEQGVVR